jgi:hypothetical protein
MGRLPLARVYHPIRNIFSILRPLDNSSTNLLKDIQFPLFDIHI